MTLFKGFDQLQKACERALDLLEDRQPGLYTWNKAMVEAIKQLDVAVKEFTESETQSQIDERCRKESKAL